MQRIVVNIDRFCENDGNSLRCVRNRHCYEEVKLCHTVTFLSKRLFFKEKRPSRKIVIRMMSVRSDELHRKFDMYPHAN